jgi:hypothetical protein
MAAAKRVVRHAVFAYVDPKGVYRMAVRGDTIELDGDELERAERFGSVAKDEAALAKELGKLRKAEIEYQTATFGAPIVVEGAESSPAGAQADDSGEDDETSGGDDLDEFEDDGGDDAVLKAPAKTAKVDAWVAYRVGQFGDSGFTADVAKERELSKAQLQDDAFIASLAQQLSAPAEQPQD